MTVEEVLEVLCTALEIRPGSLRLETPIASIESWDSIGWMNVTAAADSRFNTQITAADIRSFRTVGDVVNHLLQKA